ncbi:MAG: alpha/beta hydrolase [Cytophagales bacterium]|nr:alpha/beta hydrolase [Bernardetiaceae bacterium]MDW8206065.1 alpha/beta hydrolase [Cytophagales bacterium]
MATIRDILQYPLPVAYVALPQMGEIAVTDLGSGDMPLIWLHGLGSNIKAWQHMLPDFFPHRRCIAIDLPGFGKSVKSIFPCTMTFFAETVCQLLNQLAIHNYVLVGHSMGGQIAMHIAHCEPNRCRGIALFAPAGFETFTTEAATLIKKWFQPTELVKAAPETIKANMERNFFSLGNSAQELVNERLSIMQATDYELFAACVGASVSGMLNEPVFQWLPDLQQPTLVVYGEEDRYIPNQYFNPTTTAAIAQAGAAKLPRAELHLLPNCGHFPPIESASTCNALLNKWLQTNFL